MVPKSQIDNPFPSFCEIFEINVKPHRCPKLKVKILDFEIDALADTGAALSIINSRDLIDRLGLTVHTINLTIKTADGTTHKCLGGVQIPYTYGKSTQVVPTVIVTGISQPLILGMNFLNQFEFKLHSPYDPRPLEGGQQDTTVNLIDMFFVEDYFALAQDPIAFKLLPAEIQELKANSPSETDKDLSLEIPTLDFPPNLLNHPDQISTEHNLTSQQRVELFEVIKLLPCTQEGQLGRTGLIEHRIDVQSEVQLRRKQPMYKYSPTVEREVDSEVARMKKLGVIEECNGPVDFLNPILPVKKSSGKWRICLDSRGLNQITKPDDFPFPSMTNILHRIKKSRYFTIIDLSESYYQVPLEESAKIKLVPHQ